MNLVFTLKAASLLSPLLRAFDKPGKQPERRHGERRLDQRRAVGDNQRLRFLMETRTAVYLETRKGDLEIISDRPSAYRGIENALPRSMGKWDYSDRYSGKHVSQQQAAQHGLNELHRFMGDDHRGHARVGDMVDVMVNTIWRQYTLVSHDRRVTERRRHSSVTGRLQPAKNITDALPA